MKNPYTLVERNLVPDAVLRFAIRRLLAKRLRQETEPDDERQQARLMKFVAELKRSPLAVHTQAANEQHYEVPTRFFQYCLGPHLKYSSCYWPEGIHALQDAEQLMLAMTCDRARLADGQDILELGCGWGSLSLYMAAKYPLSRIVAVSNSRTQKEFIDAEAQRRNLGNLRVVTADINAFSTTQAFDRVVSVEMFEHVRNYEVLFAHVASWMKPDALLFVHVFCHARFAYPFEVQGDDDWMARYFFTGGLMPSADLFHYFQRHLRLLEQWTVNGRHYERTLNTWLRNMDAHRAEIMPLLAATYGPDQALRWWVYWRIFYMSCAELFGYRQGTEWFVSHYLFEKKS